VLEGVREGKGVKVGVGKGREVAVAGGEGSEKLAKALSCLGNLAREGKELRSTKARKMLLRRSRRKNPKRRAISSRGRRVGRRMVGV